MSKVFKQITLLVDENYNNEWLLKEAKPSEITEILKIGCTGYTETRNVVINEHLKNAESQKYNLINEKHKEELNELEEKIKKMRKEYEEKIDVLIQKHKQEIDIYYSGLMDENRELKNNIHEREDILRKEYYEKEKELRKDLLKFKDIYSFSDNSRKGDIGEKNISIRLQKLFPDAEVRDIHKTDNSGDIWIKFPKDNCVILVESKLKNVIKTVDDIEKFKKDIIQNTYNIDCGLFVSLLPASIPNLGDLYISTINDKYVGYITDVLNEPIKLQLMIKVLRYLNKTSSKEITSNKNELLEQINNFLDKAFSYRNVIQNLKKNNDELTKIINKNSQIISDFYTNITNDITKIDDFLNDNNMRSIAQHSYQGPNNDFDFVRQKIRKYYNEHNTKPLGKNIYDITGFSKSKINKLGGINFLIEESLK